MGQVKQAVDRTRYVLVMSKATKRLLFVLGKLLAKNILNATRLTTKRMLASCVWTNRKTNGVTYNRNEGKEDYCGSFNVHSVTLLLISSLHRREKFLISQKSVRIFKRKEKESEKGYARDINAVKRKL